MPNYRRVARRAARQAHIDPGVFVRQIQQESGFRRGAVSPAGARGIAQIMPGTARGWGVNPDNPRQALHAAAQHMADYVRRFGSYKNALVAYNAGPGRVGHSLPTETSNYIKTILGGHHPAARAARPGRRGRRGGGGTTVRTVTSTPAVDNRAARYQLVSSFLGSKHADPVSFATQFKGLADIPATSSSSTKTSSDRNAGGPIVTTPATPVRGARRGDPVAHGTGIGGRHETAGLAGYPARDYMAPAGSAAVAPVSGKVTRFSGHDPASGPTQGVHGPFGYSMYIQGDDGRSYFLTHMGSRNVKVGQRIRAGQRIGTVGNYAKFGGANHIHMGVRG